MDFVWSEILNSLPNAHELARVSVRLVASAIFGAVIGYERQLAGKPAGLRTHMLVTLGATVFVLVPVELGVSTADVGRVVQGVAAGVGFLGAGAILKREDRWEVEGLTTAAAIWLTAAIGVAIGIGGLGIAMIATALSWVVLFVLGRLEARDSK